jgi:hypothetical protein
MRSRARKLLWFAPLAILAIPLFAFIGGTIVQLLWNWLLPAIFGVREITFWQALGMLALCRILLGGRGGHGWSRSKSRMGPEMRERMRQRMRERFGFSHEGGPSVGESTEL